jgi:DNA repair exonuclease SbcCD nuclease subunit
MDKKVLLFSDLHVHPHKKSQKRLEDCLSVLGWVFDIAQGRGITDILFGGDLFHDRHKIDVFTYQRVFEVLHEKLTRGRFNLYLLLGNHDLWYSDRTCVSSVTPLSALPGVKIISKPERLRIAGGTWDFIPFTHNPVETLQELKAKQADPMWALGHIAVDGAILHGTQQSDVAVEHDGDMVRISPSLFNCYEHTYLGHYHAEQRVNSKVEYIGSPLQLSFGEAFQDKHLIVHDCETGEKEYIKNDFSPKHLIISVDEKDKYDLTNNFVQLRVQDISATDLITMKKEMQANSPIASLEIKQQKKRLDEHVIRDAKAILYQGDEMLERYAKEVGHGDLDFQKLVSVGKRICQKTG